MRLLATGFHSLGRHPLLVAVAWAMASWFLAGWWWGPVKSYALSLKGQHDICNVLGLAEDGSLVGYERTPNSKTWSVWKRTFPDGGREDVWKTEGQRTTPPDDVSFRLQEGGRWLLVAKFGTTPEQADDPIVDLKTGKVYSGEDDGMRWVSPDGRFLLTDDPEDGIRVSELATNREVGRIEDTWIDAMSSDGQWMAGETSGELRVWRITDDGVTATEIRTAAAHPPAVRLGASNDADYQRTCQFTDDNKRFLVFGDHRLECWNLESGVRERHETDLSPLAISDDGHRAYERNGHVSDIQSGRTLVESTGWKNDITGVRVRPNGWFLSQRSPQSSWWGRGWPGAQFRIGPYTVAIQADSSLQTVGCDLLNADTQRRVSLPRWFLPSVISPGGYREEWSFFTHLERLAFYNEESGLVRVIDMPPDDNTMRQVLMALVLFAAPGAWCLRRGVGLG